MEFFRKTGMFYTYRNLLAKENEGTQESFTSGFFIGQVLNRMEIMPLKGLQKSSKHAK
jgi:hypothetical protein